MDVRKIRLRNFKCFQSVEIDCAKITLLTGANSSGKSSLLDSLLGAVQSARFPLFYSPNGDYVNMGDYSEVSFNHAKRNKIGIAFELRGSDEKTISVETEFSEHPKTRQPTLNHLNFESPTSKVSLHSVNHHYEGSFSYTPDTEMGGAIIKRMQIMFTELSKAVEAETEKASRSSEKPKAAPVPDLGKLLFTPTEGKVKLSSEFEFPDQSPDQRIEHFVAKLQIDSLPSPFAGFGRVFNYISSFRHPPERTYYRRTKAIKVGRYGENHIDQLIEWEQSESRQFKTLLRALQGLGLLHEIHTKTLSGGRFDIKVRPSHASTATSLIDVGFGVSQFLPIIIADLQLEKGGTLAISQPEIHLHPSAQSLLGDYFWKNVTDDNKRYIIETHSEYLLNKLRVLVAKGDLKPDDLAVYYLRKPAHKSECHRVTFTKDGKIEGAPRDFFDTYMCDVMAIALNS
jgi:predicted ATPase